MMILTQETDSFTKREIMRSKATGKKKKNWPCFGRKNRYVDREKYKLKKEKKRSLAILLFCLLFARVDEFQRR